MLTLLVALSSCKSWVSGGPRGLQIATLMSPKTLELNSKVTGDFRVATLQSRETLEFNSKVARDCIVEV